MAFIDYYVLNIYTQAHQLIKFRNSLTWSLNVRTADGKICYRYITGQLVDFNIDDYQQWKDILDIWQKNDIIDHSQLKETNTSV